MTEVPKKPRKMRREGVEPMTEFVAFNFAQATARIIDNIGFTSTKPSVLELLSRLMERYFEDMCKRIAYSKEEAGRSSATIDDVEKVYAELQISIDDFQEYTRQVRPIPSVPQMPIIPVQGPNKTDLTVKSPRKKIVPLTDEVIYEASREICLQASINEFLEFLDQIKSSKPTPEHPLVSLNTVKAVSFIALPKNAKS